MKSHCLVLFFVLFSCKKEDDLRNDLLVGSWEIIDVMRFTKSSIPFQKYSMQFLENGLGYCILKDTLFQFRYDNYRYELDNRRPYKLHINREPKYYPAFIPLTIPFVGFEVVYDAEFTKNKFSLISASKLPLDSTFRERDFIEYIFEKK